jgi:DNA replication protein DnaC
LSKLQIAAQTGIARNTLKKYIKEFTSSGLSFEEINELSDKELVHQTDVHYEDRHGKGASIITSQVPVNKWYDIIGEQTIADAILDRSVHNVHRLELKGESMRKKRASEKLNPSNKN